MTHLTPNTQLAIQAERMRQHTLTEIAARLMALQAAQPTDPGEASFPYGWPPPEVPS